MHLITSLLLKHYVQQDQYQCINNKCLPFRQCRQEIEDCICSVILKHQKLSSEKKNSHYQMKPQVFHPIIYFIVINLSTVMTSLKTNKHVLSSVKNSAFAMDEDLQKASSSSVKTTTEAFKVSIYCYL